MMFQLECEREEDGRWLAEVARSRGVLAYDKSANEAMANAEVLAQRVLAEQLEDSEGGATTLSSTPPATSRLR